MFFLDSGISNDINNVENACSSDSGIFVVYQIAYWVIRIIQFGVPFALIIWGSLDFFKAVIAGDEKEMKQKRKPFLHRVIAAVLVLILPSLVNLVLKNIDSNSDFVACWKAVQSDTNINLDLPDPGE